MSDEPKKSFLRTGLKWAFRIAVWGVGFGIGSELVTEFLAYGFLHGATPISGELQRLSLNFTEPIMNTVSDWIGGVAGLASLQSMLETIHGWFGITGAFAAKAHTVGTTAVQETMKAGMAPLIPGLPN